MNSNTNRYSVLVVAGVISLALGGCGSGSSGNSSDRSGSASVTTAASRATAVSGVTVLNFGYSGSLTVKPGQKVPVTNEDAVAHTLTDKKTHLFDTGNLAASGGTGTFTAPAKPGSYPFGCLYHPEMAGTLIVKR